ncbi:MAG: hypothetical protein ACNYPD_03990 [Candidatus Halichondribacter symbioticus]
MPPRSGGYAQKTPPLAWSWSVLRSNDEDPQGYSVNYYSRADLII